MLTYFDTPLPVRPGLPIPRDGCWDAKLAPVKCPAAAAPLAAPGALAVTTGQQPGLFTGPLYTIHKALSARALARELERRWKRPVVPVFWLAGYDHDFAEAGSATWLGADGGLVTGKLPDRGSDAPQLPMSREPLPPRAVELLTELGAALPQGPARDQVLEWLGRHYRDGTTVAAAFTGAMSELLEPLGIVSFDPVAPPATTAAAPFLLEALRRAPELDALLVTRAAELDAADRSVDVKVGDGATLVFLDGTNGRDRLVVDGDGFRTRRGGERFTFAELERIAAEEPGRLSPNVLLRPVLESSLIPTVAYVAGPAELRYLALAEVLYRPLGVFRQLPVPRWSGLLIEPRVTRTLEKFQISLEDLVTRPAEVEQGIVRSMVPDDFEPAFAELRQGLESGYERIVAVARQIDPTLEKPATSTKGGALSAAADLEKRLLGAQKRRQGELIGQLDRARTAIAPGGSPQERVVGLPAFAGRYGLEILTSLAEHIGEWYRVALEGHPAST